MDKNRLFSYLKKQDSASLVSLLERAYDTMNTNQRRKVFGSLPLEAGIPKIDEAQLLKKTKTFYDESLKAALKHVLPHSSLSSVSGVAKKFFIAKKD